jgi:dipeptidase D
VLAKVFLARLCSIIAAINSWIATMPTSALSSLAPHIVWKHFQTLCEIPRPSKQEQQLRSYLIAWATQLGLDTQLDPIGNLVIRKAATTGMAHCVGVILQAHLDMVTQANRNTVHDFLKDPIRPIVQDGWLIAENTTLGADNGIGVALAMAVLEANDLRHGPLEVLFTIDEEAGMSGARHLQPGMLQGQWLFNIDTEEWGELYLGCAASIDLEIQQPIATMAAPSDLDYFELSVSGLKGGHSGVDIHLGRGNANVILLQFLAQYLPQLEGHLVQCGGGTARNALAREAQAIIAISSQQVEALTQAVERYQQQCLASLEQVDAGVRFELQPHAQQPTLMLDPQQQQQWLDALAGCPYGVAEMSADLADVVQTSNNIGVLKLSAQGGQSSIMVRSMANAQALAFAQSIQQHFAQFAITAELKALVSGWSPNPNSAALKCLQAAYQQAFALDPKLKVIHAGLECGIIAEHYPRLEMVSFGPDIRGAHAPGERVHIDSVANCWTLLTTALQLVH